MEENSGAAVLRPLLADKLSDNHVKNSILGEERGGFGENLKTILFVKLLYKNLTIPLFRFWGPSTNKKHLSLQKEILQLLLGMQRYRVSVCVLVQVTLVEIGEGRFW